LVAGSTWRDDEQVLAKYHIRNPGLRMIIVPHETDAANIADVQRLFPGSVLYSELLQGAGNKPDVLIVDVIGILARLYHYATLAYVGGGFTTDGVHNVLEAAVYGKPVLLGPRYDKYIEAAGLVASGGGITFADAAGFAAEADALLLQERLRAEKGKAAADYVARLTGATEKIISFIEEKRLVKV
jgi:3-deoxy-D-manno-octulosonic-acid transferase